MSYTVTKYPQGTFSWCDVASTDFPKTKEFLTKLFGWTATDMPTEPGKPDYTMFYLEGQDVAGGAPTFMPDMPSFWTSYISVDNLEEMVTKAQHLGAKVTMPPMDVLDSGRLATIIDPVGASVALWQPKKHIGAKVVNTIGAMCWNELYTNNLEKAKEFYGSLFDWKFETNPANYTTIYNNGRRNGGIFILTPEMQSMPPNWMVYFTVANLNESLVKAKELGAQIWMDIKNIDVGRIATIADPTGAGMMLIEMKMEPDHWKE